MNIKYGLPVPLLALTFALIVSCSSTKIVLDVPEEKSEIAEKIKVSGVKGKRLPGSKRSIRFERTFSGELKDGWTVGSDIYDKPPGGVFSEEAARRSLLLNFGIGINDVSSKLTDKYQFKLSDSTGSVIVVCKQQYAGKSKRYDILNRVNFSTADRQASNFAASVLFSNNTAITEWFMELKYDRETPGGIIATTLREGMAAESGFVTNKTDTIQIKPLFINRNAEQLKDNSMFKTFEVVGGYEFILKDKTIGIVDTFNPSVWLFSHTGRNYQLIVAAASTALLLRNR